MTNVTVDINSKRALSESYNPEYERRAFMGTVASEKYGEGPWVDPLDPRLLQLLQGRIPYKKINYTNRPITGIANDEYLSTTPWWLILMFNGYLHAQEIPDGAPLKIPSMEFISNALYKNKQSERGKIVRV